MSVSSTAFVLVARLLGGVEEPIVAAPPETVEAPTSTTTMIVWVDAAAPASQWNERVQRVEAELAALGVKTVLFVPSAVDAGTPDVMREMIENDATIAIWIAADRDRAELWRLEGQRLVTTAIVTGEASENDGTFAVRTAEVAHALATEVPPIVDEPAPPPVVAPPAAPPSPPPQPFARADVRLGVGVGGASRGLGVVISPMAGAGVRLGDGRRLGLDAEASVTALRGIVRGDAGSAKIGWFIGRVHVGMWPVPRARVSPFFGLGGGVLVAWTSGRALGAYEGRSDTTVTAIGSMMLDLAIRLSSRMRLRPGARIGVALPPLSIETGGARHRTALPLGEVAVALDVLVGVRR
jgi:hypothetical protein